MTDMTPPEAPQSGNIAADRGSQPAVSSRLNVLKKRADFTRAARAAHIAKPGFVLQMRARRDDEPAVDGYRVGFTCSKKVGNAVARNRAKRRLREITRLTLPSHGRSGMDYVLIGRKGVTADMPFSALLNDLAAALQTLHKRQR